MAILKTTEEEERHKYKLNDTLINLIYFLYDFVKIFPVFVCVFYSLRVAPSGSKK